MAYSPSTAFHPQNGHVMISSSAMAGREIRRRQSAGTVSLGGLERQCWGSIRPRKRAEMAGERRLRWAKRDKCGGDLGSAHQNGGERKERRRRQFGDVINRPASLPRTVHHRLFTKKRERKPLLRGAKLGHAGELLLGDAPVAIQYEFTILKFSLQRVSKKYVQIFHYRGGCIG